MEAEYGTSGPIRFGGFHVTLHDSAGNEIEIPECKKCGRPMNLIMGKEVIDWYCHCEEYEAKFVYNMDISV